MEARPFKLTLRIKKLKWMLEKTAFASLIADICISAITLVTLKVGAKYTVGVLFIVNYILTAIVVIALILMAYIASLQHYTSIKKILRLFKL
jgi:hypothetical protein